MSTGDSGVREALALASERVSDVERRLLASQSDAHSDVRASMGDLAESVGALAEAVGALAERVGASERALDRAGGGRCGRR